MNEPLVIKIDVDKKCFECGKGHALQSGICLTCVNKAMSKKPMRSPEGKQFQKYMLAKLTEIKDKP